MTEHAHRGPPAIARHWSPLAAIYLVLAVVGLVGTWTFNAFAIAQARDFLGDWTNSGPSVSSLTVDLMVAAVAGSILIIVEARRLGMKRGWLYVVLAGVTAFAFVFPLFLAMRERTLVSRTDVGHPAAPE
jgi:hypothetical protein